MRKFQALAGYAASIAPLINAAHVTVHASSRADESALVKRSGIQPGFLVDLRFTLPRRSLTRAQLATIYRYGAATDLEPEIQEHLAQGTLAVDAGGALAATGSARAFIDGLYEIHAAAAAHVWPDVTGLATLAGKVLDTAVRAPGGAFELVAPPYEPVGAPAGVLLFNRLAALRYHRADAHAASWRAAGLSAKGIVALRDGPLRREIEDRTDAGAAAPYEILTERERLFLLDGLRELV